MSMFSIFDLILLGLALFIVIRASMRGFLYEVFSTANIVISFVISFLFYKQFETVVRTYLSLEKLTPLISFLILFLACSIAIKILHFILSGMLNNETISNVDHALGFFLGALKALAVVSLIIILLFLQPFFSVQTLFSKSVVATFLLPILKQLLGLG